MSSVSMLRYFRLAIYRVTILVCLLFLFGCRRFKFQSSSTGHLDIRTRLNIGFLKDNNFIRECIDILSLGEYHLHAVITFTN